jgi:anaerobic magnesium-protoporphyrin IX monomethyl ester cyclase
MSKKVLLVYPGILSNFFPEIPMPLIYIAWALKKAGYEPEIFDMRLDDFKKIRHADYLFIGITSMTGIMIKEAIKFVKYIKGMNSAVPIVWGGVHVSMLPEQSLMSPYVDIVVRGEGELTVQELAGALERGADLSGIKGISYKKSGAVFSNPDREFMDLDTIDIELPYELLDMSRYTLEYFPVHTSRGCPYRCGFCYNLSFNKRKWRFKSAARVLREIEYVIGRFKCRAIAFFTEDEFFIDVRRVKEICEGMVQRDLNITWASFCRFDSFKKVDDDMLKLLEKSGCTYLSFGAESGSKRILDEVICKDIKIEDTMEGTAKLAKTDITQVVSFMSGLPTETDADMALSFDLIDRLAEINPKIYFNGIVLYTPYPGTTLYERIKKDYNYRSPSSLEEWADFRIFRDVGNNWHSKQYIKKYKGISILTRFPFWRKEMRMKDIEKSVLGGERFTKFPINIIYWTLSNIAIWRWKHRYFKFQIEWNLLEFVLEHIRGFV